MTYVTYGQPPQPGRENYFKDQGLTNQLMVNGVYRAAPGAANGCAKYVNTVELSPVNMVKFVVKL